MFINYIYYFLFIYPYYYSTTIPLLLYYHILIGMIAGGESVFSGITSGIAGLITRPFEEGRKGGTLGFAKGMGLGVAGLVTKPILGLVR